MDPPGTRIPRLSRLPVRSSPSLRNNLSAATVSRSDQTRPLEASTLTVPRGQGPTVLSTKPAVTSVAAPRTIKPKASNSNSDGLRRLYGSLTSPQPDESLPIHAPLGTPKSRKPRPSLSDRTIESLANVAATPVRRKSNFFQAESPLTSPSYTTSTYGQSTLRKAAPSPRTLSPPKRYVTAKPSGLIGTPSKVSNGVKSNTPVRRSVTTSGITSPLQSERQIASARKAPTSIASVTSESTPRKASNSSALLRAQIAKAKQEARKTSSKPIAASTFAFETDDPFNQGPKDGGGTGLLRKRIDAARLDGRLNIAGMALSAVPDEVLHMYDFDPESTIAWSECVDLVRLNAADNEIQTLPEHAFPDKAMGFDQDDETTFPFGGLEMLDLHGNRLVGLPMGIRRMENLTILNLARNRLRDINIVTEIPNLRELRLGENWIDALPDSISQLTQLEVLEMQHNQVTALPDSLRNLSSLRVLNIAHNQVQDLRMDMLSELPLVHISASKNKLSGHLVADKLSMPRLQSLDVSCNGLSGLTASPDDTVEVPKLQELNLSFNRISALPSIATWISLTNLLAEDNAIKEFPVGFIGLSSLRKVDFSGNDIKVLDPLISRMAGLEVLTVTANPLRDRKFLIMTTDEMKKNLAARLEATSFAD